MDLNLKSVYFTVQKALPYMKDGGSITTDTPAFEKFIPADQVESVKTQFASIMPTGRIGQPSDIGKTAVFLASDDSSFMLGAELLVDGGMTYLAK
jgi:NAD(P)-dependent dehydrogenase (short-subunit alcohol dehydrogenase family)